MSQQVPEHRRQHPALGRERSAPAGAEPDPRGDNQGQACVCPCGTQRSRSCAAGQMGISLPTTHSSLRSVAMAKGLCMGHGPGQQDTSFPCPCLPDMAQHAGQSSAWSGESLHGIPCTMVVPLCCLHAWCSVQSKHLSAGAAPSCPMHTLCWLQWTGA